MFHVQNLFYFILLHLIIATPQINLYYTDWISGSESERDNALQHNCLRIDIDHDYQYANREIISYCMSELPSKFNVENDNFFPKFTFAELWKQNITSEQLYLWSAPIDIIERYQFYLNQLSTTNDLSLATEIFYNCTMPRFGPMCQYQLYYHYPDQSSLLQIVRDFYQYYRSKPTNLTCYIHLQCTRGPFPSCLDWSEICDGKIDCLDDEFDEEHCWQLEINQCKDNEYRCINGQCIPRSFFREEPSCSQIDCIDASDRTPIFPEGLQYTCYIGQPSFSCDEVRCDYTHLTSSCLIERIDLLLKSMFSIKDNSVSEHCWSALKCIFNIPHSDYPSCDKLCEQDACIEIVKNICPDMLYFPNVPVFFGHIYFAFKKNNSQYLAIENIGLLYICYHNSRYDPFFNFASKISFNNTTCFVHETVSYPSNWSNLWSIMPDTSLQKLYNELKKYQLLFSYTSAFCNRSNMYQCINSYKCISIHRLMDNKYDCPFMDDENMFEIHNIDLIEQLKQSHFKCEISNKYIHQTLIKNRYCDCENIRLDWCEDERENSFDFRKKISFQTICDGFIELIPVTINGKNETDETECEQWECDNIYTHCNDRWNCPNGADELGCRLPVPFNCSSNHHICVSPHTNQLMCLPIGQANDGKIDCLGGYDEPILCRSETFVETSANNFHCRNQSSALGIHYLQLCDGYKDCGNGDDEQFCTTNQTVSRDDGICRFILLPGLSRTENYLCYRTFFTQKGPIVYFILSGSNNLVKHVTKNIKSSSIIQMSHSYQSRCHRGLDLRVWLNNKKNLTTTTCLCPPSFYGDRCQYQNQRISLTIQFRALSDSWQTSFAIVISLIDDSDKRIIHSYEQITYVSVKYCDSRFNIYLIYSTRPKDSTKNYSIHIDIYEKLSLIYRGSLLLPVNFPFLPVHRLAFIIDIPRSDDDKTQICSNNQCVHGKCIKYSNNPENLTFCRCDQGWSGRYCTIQHTCICASDSLCIGISANNQSICICPMNKFGSRCLLTDTICLYSTCYNGGQCILKDDYMMLNQNFICVCPEGFSGDRCEIVDNKFILSFDKDIVLSQFIFIHFMDFTDPTSLVRATTFRTIPLKQDSVVIYWSQTFHLVFTELFNKTYYLIIVQNTYHRPTTIVKKINVADRCPHINELFNETFIEWHLLRRIKYYHLPCQKQSLNLSCFYDDVHVCLCYNYNRKRLANCFNFDHNMTFNCFGQSECENGAQCFQDHPTCPKRSICMCPPCFYGRRCQFSTRGFGLSLDAILGYHIVPDVNLTHQPLIVQFSLVLTIIFMMAGLIDGILCMITFKNKIVRKVGCGLYLLGSSMTTLFTIIIFGLKFFILLLAQMKIISNRSFLQVQCISLDFLLRVCLNMDQWLNACVAMERALTVIKATRFNKKKSKRAAKFVIVILLIVIVGTSIHDPIYRRLIDEENDANEKRIWCIVSYPSILQIFNSFMQTFHFSCPFMINLVSAIVLITTKSRQQSNLHTQRAYNEILQEQVREHKHLLFAPIVLVILALPRLILTFISKCMKSANDSWLFLIGYFISFIPSMLTFIIFILSSKFYKKEFQRTVTQYRTNFRRRLHLIS